MTLNSTLAIVIGDFSREATFRFCSQIVRLERDLIKSRLPLGAAFYDEYRQLTLNVMCDLPFIKAPHLTCGPQVLLNDRILVGFPHGIPAETVRPRLGARIFQALTNAYERGLRRALILFPCNTLAAICWELAEIFGSSEAILELLHESGFPVQPYHARQARQIVREMQLTFPTPPEAVIDHVIKHQQKAVLPLGTLGIAEVFAQALRRSGQHLDLVHLDADQRGVVLEAIKSGIAADTHPSAVQARNLKALITRIQSQYGDGVAVVLACTDLTYDFGIDSTRVYAEAVVDLAYRGQDCLPTLLKD